jgi:hypothetical protein
VFIDNKYAKWYFDIIENRQQNPVADGVYTEEHHIIPRWMSGSDDESNLVRLTAREHTICHWLLRYMVTGKDKHLAALAHNMIVNVWDKNQQRYKRLNSKSVAKLKEAVSVARSEAMKIVWSDPEYKQRQSETMKIFCSQLAVKQHRSKVQKIAQSKPARRQHHSEAMKIVWSDPAYQQRQHEIFNDPEVKQRQSEAIKLVHARPGHKRRQSEAMKLMWSDIDRRQRQREARSCPVNQLDRLTEKIINTFVSIDEASRKTGANGNCISACCRGKLKTSGGFKWEFASSHAIV